MFEFVTSFFTVVLYKPLFNSLILLYNYVPGHDFGVSIIFLTLIIRIILFPLSVRAVKSQKALQKLQPKLQEVQKKYKDDKEKQAKEVLEIYKSEKINPFSGMLLALIQLPILITLYTVFRQGLNPKELINLYSFVASPGHVNSIFLKIIDLSKPNFIIAILAGVMQYFQTKMFYPKTKPATEKSKTPDFSQVMQKQMLYGLPIFTLLILLGLPSALGLYWTASGVFTIIQQYFILRQPQEQINAATKTIGTAK